MTNGREKVNKFAIPKNARPKLDLHKTFIYVVLVVPSNASCMLNLVSFSTGKFAGNLFFSRTSFSHSKVEPSGYI